MIRIGICDDENILLEKIKEHVENCLSHNQIFASIHSFDKGKNLLYEIEDGTGFDLLLLDIEMPEMDGMELAAQIKKLLPDVFILFITSHMKYALDAYELSVFRYIPKNDLDGRLDHALLDAAKLIELQMRESYIIQNQNRLERIPLKNLLYITHEGKNALLVTNILEPSGEKKSFKVRKTMQQVFAELNGNEFIFIDRGCIVNLSQIMSVRENFCILKDNTQLPVSQSRMQNLKENLMLFWKQQL